MEILLILMVLLSGLLFMIVVRVYPESRKHYVIYGAYLIFTTMLLIAFMDTVKCREEAKFEEEVLISKIVVYEQITFEDSVKRYIKELNIKHPDIVFNQARIESANFTSGLYRANNNMFGFKKAHKRANTQIGTNRGYAVYNNWQECVMDYALYQTYSAKNLSRDAYIAFLGKYYAEDPQYMNKIQ